MSSDVQDFIAEVLKRWPPPRTWSEEQEDAWSDDVIAEFSSEKKPIFDQALSVLKRQTRQYSGTPRIEDVIKAVNQAVKEVGAQRRAGMLKLEPGSTYEHQYPWSPPVEQRVWTKERIKLAYDLLPTEGGRLAATEGWAAPFWDYIVMHGEAPQPHLYPKLRKQAVTMDWCLEIQRDGRGPVKAIIEAAQFRMANAQRLADIAMGKTMPSKADYAQEFFKGTFTATVKDNPPSKYADENHAEGRGWKGMTA